VRLVVTRGVFANLALSLIAHAVQVMPLLLATGLALLIDRSSLSLFALAATPLLCASVPLGQGMIVWTYTQVREAPDPQPAAAESDATVLAALRITGRHARGWTVLIALPIVSLVVIGLSLVRPSRVPAGKAPAGELLAELVPRGVHAARVVLPDTALEISATRYQLTVAASDGGGAGRLPLTAAAPIERVRVVRVRDAYAIELLQGGASYVAWVDRAGVRLDDELRVRLLDRASPLLLLVVLCALFATGVVSVPVLNDLGRVQRGYRMLRPRRPSADVLALDHARSVRRARLWAALLLPLSMLSVAIALHAAGAF
jgi:hypothetical protein